MLGLKVSAILSACIYMVAVVHTALGDIASSFQSPPDTQCPSDKWHWPDKDVCLPTVESVPESTGNPPYDWVCPLNRYWHNGRYCAPFSQKVLKAMCPTKHR
ncbi:unnamed protein product [Rhizoctonia solani]|uniref:CBM1 domain-containing protein n=1 Tax=Rhizoctonia solani TaxID=456999 RepID=A0A8H3ANL2_9AGAM|nr:unnamed protein product [Rhizoctonia solani]